MNVISMIYFLYCYFQCFFLWVIICKCPHGPSDLTIKNMLYVTNYVPNITNITLEKEIPPKIMTLWIKDFIKSVYIM